MNVSDRPSSSRSSRRKAKTLRYLLPVSLLSLRARRTMALEFTLCERETRLDILRVARKRFDDLSKSTQ